MAAAQRHGTADRPRPCWPWTAGGSKVDAVLVGPRRRRSSAGPPLPATPTTTAPAATPTWTASSWPWRPAVGRPPPGPTGCRSRALGHVLPRRRRPARRTTAASPAGSRRAGWTRTDVLRNDTFAVLRAGTDRTWGVAVVCGYGTNCSAVAPDGRTFRFPAVGDISGDWGGGHDIGSAALWYALRAQDGRGERTALERVVPAHFGFRRPRQVMEAMYFGRIPSERVVELPPVVFRAAGDGDAVARSIVDKQADEVVAMAGTAIRRLRMTALDVDVVLGGGVFPQRGPRPFRRGSRKACVRSRRRCSIRRLTAPPAAGGGAAGAGPPGGLASRRKARLPDERSPTSSWTAGTRARGPGRGTLPGPVDARPRDPLGQRTAEGRR